MYLCHMHVLVEYADCELLGQGCCVSHKGPRVLPSVVSVRWSDRQCIPTHLPHTCHSQVFTKLVCVYIRHDTLDKYGYWHELKIFVNVSYVIYEIYAIHVIYVIHVLICNICNMYIHSQPPSWEFFSAALAQGRPAHRLQSLGLKLAVPMIQP